VFIEVEELKPESLHVHHIFPIGDIQFAHEDAMLSEHVTADFVLSHNDRDLYLDGTVETAIRFKCSRCAKEYSRALTTEFRLSYLPQPDYVDENVEIELKYEDMGVAYYDGVALDVNLMVLEQIELAIPMKFICQEDCKGLCYRCGADLNQEPCLCENEVKESRFSVLQDFRNKMTER
jgi:uncharacterized protein